ncbi:MAG: hypothetical protein WC820_01080 [Spirochaetales bacterium]|jgi:hypothetical protein
MIAKPISEAQPARNLAEARVRPGLVALFKLISPFYLHALLGFSSIELRHAERLVNAYRDFFSGKTRLLIAFRHPYGDEAQLMGYVIAKLVGKEAARLGVKLRRPPHAHFIHGYEVPLWAGAFERWLLPRVGAVPVYHTKLDTKSIGRIRSLMKDGEYPIALAPEGQVSYSSETIPRLESGAAHICAWCVDDLARESRKENVVILPISVHHRWGAASEKRLDALIGTIEKQCGISPPTGTSPSVTPPNAASPNVTLSVAPPPIASRFNRLSAAADFILDAAERHYARFYGASIPRQGDPSRAERLDDLRKAALSAAERAFCLKPEGDEIRRVYKIRQTGWDRIFRADIERPDSLPGLGRALADRVAGEAWYASRHMELVDLTYYLDFDRLKRDDPLDLYIETAQNYYDLIARLEGGNISNRIGIRKKRATIIVGEPIPASERLSSFGRNRKTAIEALTLDLKRAYTDCIEEFKLNRDS